MASQLDGALNRGRDSSLTGADYVETARRFCVHSIGHVTSHRISGILFRGHPSRADASSLTSAPCRLLIFAGSNYLLPTTVKIIVAINYFGR